MRPEWGATLMGRGSREKPLRLGEKLAQVRSSLGVSQDGMVRLLGLTLNLTRNEVSKYERGIREPPLLVLLRYARCVEVSVDLLIDDELDLPTNFKRRTSTPSPIRKRKCVTR